MQTSSAAVREVLEGLAFRRKVLDLIAAGRSVAEVASDLGVSGQTIYNWRKQDQIARGLKPGVTSTEQAELAKARRRIAELETELAATKRANELLKQVVPSCTCTPCLCR